jgi:hypothetical protein
MGSGLRPPVGQAPWLHIISCGPCRYFAQKSQWYNDTKKGLWFYDFMKLRVIGLLDYWLIGFMVSRHTTTPVQDTTCARTHIRAPNLPRSTSPRHPVRVLAGQRTNARSCSPSFLRFRCGRRTPPAQDRGHLQRRADEAGTSPDCRVHFRSGSALGIALTGKIMTIFCLQSLFLFEPAFTG